VSSGVGALLWWAAAGVLAGHWVGGGLVGLQGRAWWAVPAWGWAACSFSVLWSGGGFPGLEVQGANVSALPLPQPSVSPAFQKGP
jgi:hypothetical protein